MSRYHQTDLIASILKRPVHERNKDFRTLCIFHNESNPSMSIDLDRGLFICFSCGARGGIYALAAQANHYLDPTQVALSTYESSINTVYEEQKDFAKLAESLRRNLYDLHPREVAEYIVNKDLDPAVIKHFRIGWNADKNSIAIPYYDEDSVPCIRYRAANGKKFFETGSRRLLYNVDDLRGRPTIILCEGESDTHRVWGLYKNRDDVGVGGIAGATFTKTTMELWALDLMWANVIYLAFDADEAGDRAASIAKEVLGEKAFRARPSRAKDISDHLAKGGTLEEIGIV